MATKQHAQNVHAYRDMLIGNAVAARKIAADRADDYKRLFDADPSSITHLLTAPVERGGLMAGVAYDRAGQPVPSPPTDYPAEWLPETRGRQVHGTVAFEDARTATEAVSVTPPARREANPAADAGALSSAQPGTARGSITVGND